MTHMSMKKVLAGAILGAAALILAGCGNKAASVQNSSSQNPPVANNEAPASQPAQNTPEEKMPAATGKVDDTVSAIIDGSNSEGAQATSTDSDATAAVGDGSDTNNLNNTYDQDSL